MYEKEAKLTLPRLGSGVRIASPAANVPVGSLWLRVTGWMCMSRVTVCVAAESLREPSATGHPRSLPMGNKTC